MFKAKKLTDKQLMASMQFIDAFTQGLDKALDDVLGASAEVKDAFNDRMNKLNFKTADILAKLNDDYSGFDSEGYV